LQRARLKKTERSATEVAVATDITARADIILHVITATIEIEMDIIERNGRATIERPPKNAHGASAKRESAMTSTTIDHAESTGTDGVDLP
jgi:hypothetical protein